MESTYNNSTVFFFFFFFPFAILVAVAFKLINESKRNPKHRLPPGPWKLPVIGSIHHLFVGSRLPHRRFQQLSADHGPLIHLKLGEVSTVVASSPDSAREVMKTHDLAFATRPLFPAIDILTYGGSNLGFGPYGEGWRQLRRIAVVELLSARRVHSFRSLREEESYNLVSRVSSADGAVNLSKMTTEMANNVAARSTIGGNLEEKKAFIEALYEGISLAAGFDLTDMFPSVAWMVSLFSGFRARVERCHEKTDAIVKRIVEQHREKRRRRRSSRLISGSEKEEETVGEDLVDVLLRLQEEGELPVELTDENIKALTLVGN